MSMSMSPSMDAATEGAAPRSLLAAVHDGCCLRATDLAKAALCLIPGVIVPLVALAAWLGDSIEPRDSARRLGGLVLGHLVLGSAAWAAAARWIGCSAGGTGAATLLPRTGAVLLVRVLRTAGLAVGAACLLVGAWPVSAALRPSLGAAVAGDGLRRAFGPDRWMALVRRPALLVAEAGFLFVEVAALACLVRGVAVEELGLVERIVLVAAAELALFAVSGAGSAALARATAAAPDQGLAPAPAGWWRPFGGWPVAASVAWAGLGTGAAALGVSWVGLVHEGDGEFEEALAWHRAAAGWPFAHDARMGAARCLRLLGRFDDADAALAEFRARSDGRLHRGLADAEGGHIEAARGWDVGVLAGRDRFARATELLAAAARALPARVPDGAAAGLWEAVYGAAGDPRPERVDAVARAGRSVRDAAELAAAGYSLGLILEMLADAGEFASATDGWAAAERAYAAIPLWAADPAVVRDLPGRRAWCAWCRKDWPRAMESFQAAVRGGPLDATVAEHHRNFAAFLRDRVGAGLADDPVADLEAARARLDRVRAPLPGEAADAALWVGPNLAWIALALDGDEAAAEAVRALWSNPPPPEGPTRAALLRETCVALGQLSDDTVLPGAARCGALGAESGHELLRSEEASADADGYVRWSVGLWEKGLGDYARADGLLSEAVSRQPATHEWGAAMRVDAAICRFWRHGTAGEAPEAAREAAAWLAEALAGGALAAHRRDEARWFMANLRGAGGDWAAGAATIEALLAEPERGTERGLSLLYEGALFYDRLLASGPADGRDAAAMRAIELVDRWRTWAPQDHASRHELAEVGAGALAAAERPEDAAEALRAMVAGLRMPEERADWLERAADRCRELLDDVEDGASLARETAGWYAELAVRAAETGDASRAGRMGYRAAWCRWEAGDREAAADGYRASMARLGSPEDAGWLAWAAHDLGDVLYQLAEWADPAPSEAEAERLHGESERCYVQAAAGIGPAQRPWSLVKGARALSALGRRADADAAVDAARQAADAGGVSLLALDEYYVEALDVVAAHRAPALRAALRRECAARAADWLAAAPADDERRLRVWTRRLRCLAGGGDLDGAVAAADAAIRERGAGSPDEREILARLVDACDEARTDQPAPEREAAWRTAAARYEAALAAWLATATDLRPPARAFYGLAHARLLRDLGRPEALDRMRQVAAGSPADSHRHAEAVRELCAMLLLAAEAAPSHRAALEAEARTLLEAPLPVETRAPTSPLARALAEMRERLRGR